MKTDPARPTPPALGILYGTAWKEERTADLVRLALEVGYRAIDTANQRKHYFEAGVGEGLARAYADGLVTRDALFLQTKFTYARGQDHRLPYDPRAPYAEQVRSSVESSLAHLGTSRLDALVLHGPSGGWGISDADLEVWAAMEAEVARGVVRFLGVSNVSADQLESLAAQVAVPPVFVQNRCYASTGLERDVRAVAQARGIGVQGFSLLTANRAYLARPELTALARARGLSAAELMFAFARALDLLPLTGSGDRAHLAGDLRAVDVVLDEAEVEALEALMAAPGRP